MKAKRKLIISMLVVSFVLLSIIATVAIAFALTQQNIKTTLKMAYTVEDIDGSVTASYAMNEDAETPLTAMQGETVLGDELVFKATDTEETESRYFMFPDIEFTSPNDYITIRYTYSNTGDKHYIASMSFEAIVNNENMKIEYGIWDSVNEEIKYSEDRYALVIPTDKELSYWIRISIADKSKNASLSCEIDWLLEACNPSELGYELLTSTTFQSTGTAGEYSVSLSNGSYLPSGNITFPSTVNGDAVTTISAGTLTPEQKAQVTSVYIPESVTTIGESAFEGYTNLETVTLEQNETASGASVQSSNGLTTIGANSFKDCSSLTELTIPSTITTFDTTALIGCSNLKNITLDTMNSNVLTAVKTLANTNGEMHVTIGNSVTSIGNFAFPGCTGLTSVTIGNNVINIGFTAFYNCEGLTSITVASENPKYYSVRNCLIETSSKTLVLGCKNSVIPTDGSVTSIGSNAFYGCTGLTGIVIPDSVTSIGSSAFSSCTGLTSVTIGNNVTSIGERAFYGCTGLTRIEVASGNTKYYSVRNCLIETSSKTLVLGCKNSVIPTDGSVTSIGSSAFSGCTGLTSIVIPDSVTSIGSDAFSSCTGLTSVTIGNNVISIGSSAFTICKGLTSIVIPDSVTSIGDQAFQFCTGLTSVTIGNHVTSIVSNAFYGCTGLTSIVIPDSVTSIGSYAFYNCTGLTSIVIPDSVTSIEYKAFYGCTGLTSVTIGNNVTSIGSNAFYGCTGLTEITIPNSVTSIGYQAFYGCTGLTSVTFKNTEGWFVASGSSATSGTNLSSEDLANTSTAATYLKSTYSNKYWKRGE